MVRHGVAPFLECSSRGDRRFSAFCAKVGGSSIEEIYQACKIFADGRSGLTWREAKGKKPVNPDQCRAAYYALWRMYLGENPHLLGVLQNATGLSDMFGQEGHVCQATVLWELTSGQ